MHSLPIRSHLRHVQRSDRGSDHSGSTDGCVVVVRSPIDTRVVDVSVIDGLIDDGLVDIGVVVKADVATATPVAAPRALPEPS